MKEPALVIVKPDGISKGLIGNILTKFAYADLEIIAIQIKKSARALVEDHYHHLRGKPFFRDLISYLMGTGYKHKKLLAIIYYGEDAIKKCRKIAGATNPEEACPFSVRGSLGRVTTKGLFENVVHVSSDAEEAEREIKLWFNPVDINRKIYSTKYELKKNHRERIWA